MATKPTGRTKTKRPPNVAEIISAIEKRRFTGPDYVFAPALPRGWPSQHAIDDFVVAHFDSDGRAARQFDKILREQTADIAELSDKLNSKALAASRGRRARLRKELRDRIALLPPDPYKRHFIDKPFLISTDAGLNANYEKASYGSWVKFDIEVTTAINAYVFLYYLWTNDSDQAVAVNIDGYLVADGWIELRSDGGFWPGDRRAEATLTAAMFPMEWWNQPATFPLVQEGQVQPALTMAVSSGGLAAGGGFDAQALFRGFDLQYRQLSVPAYGSLVILLEFVVTASASHGNAKIDFQSQDRDVVSPGVLISVM